MTTTIPWLVPYLRVVFAVTAATAYGFVLLWGNPSRHVDKTLSWHVVIWTLVAGTEAAVLELSVDYVTIPPVVYALIFTAGAAVSVWRLALYALTLRRGG